VQRDFIFVRYAFLVVTVKIVEIGIYFAEDIAKSKLRPRFLERPVLQQYNLKIKMVYTLHYQTSQCQSVK